MKAMHTKSHRFELHDVGGVARGACGSALHQHPQRVGRLPAQHRCSVRRQWRHPPRQLVCCRAPVRLRLLIGWGRHPYWLCKSGTVN